MASCSRRSSAKGWLSSSMKVTHLPPVAASALASLPICRSYTYREDIIVGTEVSEFLESHGLDLAKMNLNRDSDDEVILGGIVSRAPVVGLALNSSGLYPFRNLKLIPLEEPKPRQSTLSAC